MSKSKINHDNLVQELTEKINKLKKREKKLKKTIAELYDSEKKYRAIFENTGTITLIYDQDTIITMVNSDFAKRMGYSKEEVEGKISWTEFVVPEDLGRLLKWHALRSQNPAAAPHNYEFKVVNKSGEVLDLFMTIDMIPGTTQRIVSLIDITDRIRAEDELLRISERERQRIGQDLHDDLAPHLMGIEFLSKILLANLEKNSPTDVPQINKIRDLIQDAIEKTKRYAHGLSPVYLIDHGLVSSLKELALSTEEIYGMVCSFNYSSPVIDHDIATSTHIFYIAHEAVHNAVKHGRAKSITINLSFDNSITTMVIKDDGRGFDTETATRGMGLKIMTYRSRIIRALLSIKSVKGKGTEVMVTLGA